MHATLLLAILIKVVRKMSSAVTIIMLVPMIYAIPILDATTLLLIARIITHVLMITAITPLDATTLLSIVLAMNVTLLPVLTILVACPWKLTVATTIIVPQILAIPILVAYTPL